MQNRIICGKYSTLDKNNKNKKQNIYSSLLFAPHPQSINPQKILKINRNGFITLTRYTQLKSTIMCPISFALVGVTPKLCTLL